MASFRGKRVGDEVRAAISELLSRKIQDPRLEGVRITEARMSPDLRQATLFFSVYPADAEQVEVTRQALLRASGFLRREIGQRLRLRVTPELSFRFDDSSGNAAHIQDVLNTLDIPPEEPDVPELPDSPGDPNSESGSDPA